MRKSTLFISASLTSFMLVVLFGVVSAYKGLSGSTQQVAAQAQPTAMLQKVNAPIPAQVANVTPEEAASIASKVIGRTDLYSVESTQFEGLNAFLVTFSSGDIVYIGTDGKVLSISKLAVTVVRKSGNGGDGGDDSNNNSVSVSTSDSGEHEGGESEHESGDD